MEFNQENHVMVEHGYKMKAITDASSGGRCANRVLKKVHRNDPPSEIREERFRPQNDSGGFPFKAIDGCRSSVRLGSEPKSERPQVSFGSEGFREFMWFPRMPGQWLD
jgi:hypothetical protein